LIVDHAKDMQLASVAARACGGAINRIGFGPRSAVMLWIDERAQASDTALREFERAGEFVELGGGQA